MQPFRSLSGDGYSSTARKSNWGAFERSTSPFGIDGLSPQADDVVESEKELPPIQSPIGMDNAFGYSRDNSPPAHILNIFSPSERSESLLKALTLSPNATSSEQEFTDEEFENFNLPPSGALLFFSL